MSAVATETVQVIFQPLLISVSMPHRAGHGRAVCGWPALLSRSLEPGLGGWLEPGRGRLDSGSTSNPRARYWPAARRSARRTPAQQEIFMTVAAPAGGRERVSSAGAYRAA